MDKADFLALGPLIQALQTGALKKNFAAAATVGCQDGLQLAQQGRLAAARGAAQHEKFPLLHGETEPVQRGLRLLRIVEAQLPDLIRIHLRSSQRLMNTGVRHSAK